MKPSTPAAMYPRRMSAACSGRVGGCIASRSAGMRHAMSCASAASARQDERRAHQPRDRRRIAAHHPAVLLEHFGLVLELVERADEPVGDVGVAGGEPQRPLLAAATDQDLRPAGLDRPRHVERAVDPVVAARKAGPLLGEHRAARWSAPRPGGPSARGPAGTRSRSRCARPRSRRRRCPGWRGPGDRRRASSPSWRACAGLRYVTPVTSVPSRTRLVSRGERRQRGVRLQHRLGLGPDAADLIEVVHHRDQVEAGRLGRLRQLDDALEEPLGGHPREACSWACAGRTGEP